MALLGVHAEGARPAQLLEQPGRREHQHARQRAGHELHVAHERAVRLRGRVQDAQLPFPRHLEQDRGQTLDTDMIAKQNTAGFASTNRNASNRPVFGFLGFFPAAARLVVELLQVRAVGLRQRHGLLRRRAAGAAVRGVRARMMHARVRRGDGDAAAHHDGHEEPELDRPHLVRRDVRGPRARDPLGDGAGRGLRHVRADAQQRVDHRRVLQARGLVGHAPEQQREDDVAPELARDVEQRVDPVGDDGDAARQPLRQRRGERGGGRGRGAARRRSGRAPG